MNPSTALARVVVDELVRGGVRHAVLAPGSRSAPLAMALHDDTRVRLHVEIDERSAGFLALGIAKASGAPSVVVTTSGTAVANLLPAVVEAEASAVPLLVLTADRPSELRDTGANQTIDQAGIFGGFARASVDLGAAEQHAGVVAHWRSLAARALARATGAGEGPAGPAHVNLGFREPLVPDPGDFSESLDGRADGRPWTAARPAERAPSPADVADLLAATRRRGVVVLGDGAEPEPWLALAEAAGWPVLAESLSGGRRPGTISAYDLLLRDQGFADAHRPEVAVIAGRVALSKALRSWLDNGVEQVLVDAWGRWLDPGRAAARAVIATAGPLVDAVLNGGVGGADPGWLEGWRRAEGRARAAIDALLDDGDEPTEPRVARDLAAALPDGSTLVVASSMPVRDLDLAMAPREGLRVLGNRGASGIDGFVSTALGVALGADRPVTGAAGERVVGGSMRAGEPVAGEAMRAGESVAGGGVVAALAGDLSLLHDQNGLLLADRPDLPIVVLNNDGGAIFSFLPQARHPDGFERLFTTPHGLDLAALAALHGCGHTLLERACDLGPALAEARRAGGVHLIEARTDRDANVAFHRRLVAAVAQALP